MNFDLLEKLEQSDESLRRIFKLMLARWRSQPISSRLRDREPITGWLESIILNIM